jgi:hypothetical protein
MGLGEARVVDVKPRRKRMAGTSSLVGLRGVPLGTTDLSVAAAIDSQYVLCYLYTSVLTGIDDGRRGGQYR